MEPAGTGEWRPGASSWERTRGTRSLSRGTPARAGGDESRNAFALSVGGASSFPRGRFVRRRRPFPPREAVRAQSRGGWQERGREV